LITTSITRYSPKPATEYRAGFYDKMKLGAEAWNLAFLALDFDGVPFANDNAGAAIWRTVGCDATTGEFLNPHIEGLDLGATVASLLHLPASEFVDWAENAPVIAKLPITVVIPDWVATARSRVALCTRHPLDSIVRKLDTPVDDITKAAAYLSKFRK
jgi:hypothetical protein